MLENVSSWWYRGDAAQELAKDAGRNRVSGYLSEQRRDELGQATIDVIESFGDLDWKDFIAPVMQKVEQGGFNSPL